MLKIYLFYLLFVIANVGFSQTRVCQFYCDTICKIEICMNPKISPSFEVNKQGFGSYLINEMKKDSFFVNYFYQEESECCEDIVVNCIIDSTGQIICVKTKYENSYQKRITKILLNSPRWLPCECNGIKYNYQYHSRFKLLFGPSWRS